MSEVFTSKEVKCRVLAYICALVWQHAPLNPAAAISVVSV